MFTPQRKGRSLTPRSAERNGSLLLNPQSVGGIGFGKGKSVVDADMRWAPPQGLLGDSGADAWGSSAEVEVWKQFRKEGMLDEEALETKDKEALLERIEKLENELYDYQYNMGLLLIEKKEWNSKCNEFQQGLVEAEEVLKREKTAHLIATSEIEKREDNLRKALDVEKQCVTELEKTLREMRSEHAGVKVTADSKLAEAQALMEELQDKSLEVYAQIRTADARLAEISRKNSDVERKLQELAARESIFQRERLSLNNEKELHAEDLARQREDLQAWEKCLHGGQERLVESQSLLSQREKRTTETDHALTKKEKQIEMLRESVEKANSSLKEKEDYIHIRLTALAAKEKEVELQMEKLRKTEQDLHAKEEHLNARERVEIEQIVDDHKSGLASKMRDFEMELAEKRKSLDEELKTQLKDVEKKEKEIKLKEEKLLKREQALEKKTEKLNNDKKDHDVKSKALKKWEEAMNMREMELEKQNKQLSEDNQHLLISRAEIEAERKGIEAEKDQLLSEQENLKLTEQECEDHVKLQSKLKQENEECMILKESLAKEHEELRGERRNFEREWEVLDEKRSALSVDERKVSDEKAALEKWKRGEELRLKIEQQTFRDEMQRELDDLSLKKEAFEANMAHDRSELLEKLQRERADMVQELDLQKHQLEIDMQKKLQELENEYQQQESELCEQKTIEMDRIKSFRDLAASEMQKMKIEQAGLEREREEYIVQRKKLKEDQHEIQNDIDMLRSLSRNLKDQREEFIKERESFLSQNCKNCGTRAELAFPAVRPLHGIGVPGDLPLPSLADGYLEDRLKVCQTDMSPVGNGSQSGASGSRMSWLKACTKKIFNLSPGKRTVDSVDMLAENSNILGLGLENETSLDKADDVAEPHDLIGSPRARDGIDEAVKSPGMPYGVLENSGEINRTGADNCATEMVNEHITPSFDEQNELSSLSPLAEGGSKPQVEPQGLKQKVKRGGRRGRSKALKRTHSVHEVAEESKALLKETHDKTGQDSLLNNEVNQGDSVHTGRTTSLSRKRQFSRTSGAAASEMGANSEAHSESVSIGGRQKRRLVVPETQAAGEKRYNLRRSTIVGTGGASQAASGKIKGAKPRKPQQSLANEPSHDILNEQEDTSKHEPTSPAVMAQENDMNVHTLQRSMTDSFVEVHESSSQKIVQVQEETMQTDYDVEYSGQIVEINEDESASVLAGQEDEVYETEEGEDSDGDDESHSEIHNASIGKMLWKFFTS